MFHKTLSFGWRLILNQHFVHIDQPHLFLFLLYAAELDSEEEDSKPAAEELEPATAKRSKKQGNLCSSKRTRLSKGAGKHHRSFKILLWTMRALE